VFDIDIVTAKTKVTEELKLFLEIHYGLLEFFESLTFIIFALAINFCKEFNIFSHFKRKIHMCLHIKFNQFINNLFPMGFQYNIDGVVGWFSAT